MLEGLNGKEDWIVEENVFVGIDVSKATLDIVMRPGGSRESIPNQEAQIGELVRRLSTLQVTLLVVEATGWGRTSDRACTGGCRTAGDCR
jgi:hypothetical protein